MHRGFGCGPAMPTAMGLERKTSHLNDYGSLKTCYVYLCIAEAAFQLSVGELSLAACLGGLRSLHGIKIAGKFQKANTAHLLTFATR